eukprot:Hpha_TRINITY_DN9145_c0_g3::TRINITY_DN9145_c0_g3_i1::g.94287::m.94287/K00846/KHK; ketohexokinase
MNEKGEEVEMGVEDEEGVCSGGVVFVGNVCYDFVFSVKTHPEPDSEQRATDLIRRRGGNAANSAAVAAQLLPGVAVTFAGIVGEDGDPLSALALKELGEFGVRCDCERARGTLPVSSITVPLGLSQRSIVHYRGIPEMSAAKGRNVVSEGAEWVHFEGRGDEETVRDWMRSARKRGAVISVELEKRRCAGLLAEADVVLASRDFAEWRGGLRKFVAEALQNGPALVVVGLGSEGVMWGAVGDGG